MSETLKAQRERVANAIAERPSVSSLGLQVDLRELQRAAIVLAIRHVAALQLKHTKRELSVKAYSAAELDWLLDEPPPHSPPRCIRCGLHEGIGHPGGHPFVAQSPSCHRAHPHYEPCEPGSGLYEEPKP